MTDAEIDAIEHVKEIVERRFRKYNIQGCRVPASAKLNFVLSHLQVWVTWEYRDQESRQFLVGATKPYVKMARHTGAAIARNLLNTFPDLKQPALKVA